MWLIEEEKWDEEILRIASIPPEKLPPVRRSGEVIGPITKEFAELTGIPAGTPVVVGIADHVASALATGVRNSGDLLLKLGGAGDILFASDTLRMDPRLFIDYHPLENRYLINGCMAASGSIVKWITNLFQDTDFDRLTKEASQLPPGSKDLILLPYFLGEKTPIFDTNARGVFFGLNFGHDRAALFRSVLEAVAYGFYHHVEILQEMKCNVEHVYLSNGGARSPLWKQIVLDVIGKDGTYVPNHPGSCIGAAFIVQKSIGPTQDWQALEHFLSRGESISFSPENHAAYAHRYKIYRELYDSVKHLFPKLSQEDYS
jgi:xylulokinase